MDRSSSGVMQVEKGQAMTWNREEALRLAQILDASIGSVPAPVFAQARYDASRQLEAAVSEIDRLTAERDKLRADYAGWSEYSTELANERDAALARVKDLEAERSQQAEAYQVRGRRVEELESLAQHLESALRAIYPVYRAANLEGPFGGSPHESRQVKLGIIIDAAEAADAVLTPDLIAAIKAAGVEEP